MSICRGRLSQSDVISALIYASEPTLLGFLFGGKKACMEYLQHACKQPHGQFSAVYHWVSAGSEHTGDEPTIDGICATWLSIMPKEFQAGTVSALRDFLSPEQIIHLLAYKEALDECFVPPSSRQLCIGHVSVTSARKRSGVASRLIEHAVQYAKSQNLHEIILDVELSNEAAIECYLSAGFIATKQTYFEASNQHFSRMTLQLP